MSDIMLDALGDIDISSGGLVLNSGADSVKQSLKIRLQTFFQEWFLDDSVGVPYFQQIMGLKNPDPILVNSIFRREISKCPGVISIISLKFTIDNGSRNLIVSAEILSTDGIINFQQNIGVS